ncbi:hypothetical protein Anapl_05016 [Anas platyrhynchos]|uniref:Uncharacterized protein n=1 Tax=Anas platyrhynchos TaxID=8839 RepID=R0LGD0_ANAPL|nr:hypothetical protein Anapl_05016 [Anas platyrhynchos]
MDDRVETRVIPINSSTSNPLPDACLSRAVRDQSTASPAGTMLTSSWERHAVCKCKGDGAESHAKAVLEPSISFILVLYPPSRGPLERLLKLVDIFLKQAAVVCASWEKIPYFSQCLLSHGKKVCEQIRKAAELLHLCQGKGKLAVRWLPFSQKEQVEEEDKLPEYLLITFHILLSAGKVEFNTEPGYPGWSKPLLPGFRDDGKETPACPPGYSLYENLSVAAIFSYIKLSKNTTNKSAASQTDITQFICTRQQERYIRYINVTDRVKDLQRTSTDELKTSVKFLFVEDEITGFTRFK